MKNVITSIAPSRGLVIIMLVLMLLAGLPLAAWLDLRNLSDTTLRHQANDLNGLISGVRAYYAANVVGRVLSAPEATQVTHNYETIPGAIPLPATLSLELGQVISKQQGNITYRFVSDYPFKTRAPHSLDDFEKTALAKLRVQPNQQLTAFSGSILSRRVRLIAPVIMGPVCVNCHNIHPESPKRDWKVGDVRGIQEVTISQPIAANLFAFKHLMVYFALNATAGLWFLLLQRRHAMAIERMNRELAAANDSLAAAS